MLPPGVLETVDWNVLEARTASCNVDRVAQEFAGSDPANIVGSTEGRHVHGFIGTERLPYYRNPDKGVWACEQRKSRRINETKVGNGTYVPWDYTAQRRDRLLAGEYKIRKL